MIRINFGDYFKQGIEIVKLNEKAVEKVSKDKDALLTAVLFFAIGGALSALLTLNPVAVIGAGVFAGGFSFVSVGIFHLLAKLFGGKGKYMDYYKAVGIGSVISWLGGIPIVSFLVGIWSLVVNVTILKTVHKLSTGKAVLVVLIPVIIVLIIAAVVAMLIVAGLFALGASGGFDALSGITGNLWNLG